MCLHSYTESNVKFFADLVSIQLETYDHSCFSPFSTLHIGPGGRVEVGHFVEVDLFTSFTDKQFQATAVTTGEVLQQQWNHFFLQSAQQGAATTLATPPHSSLDSPKALPQPLPTL